MRSVFDVLMVLGLMVVLSPATAQNFHNALPCGNGVPAKLSELGIKKEAISSSLTEEDWDRGDDADSFLGWYVWMGLHACDGRLVINLSPTCVVQTVYTTRQCRVSGVRHSG